MWPFTRKENLPVYIDFHPRMGGVNSFMQNLQRYLQRHNYNLPKDYKSAKAIFFPIEYDVNVLHDCKQRGIKIIQRLDGVYYPSVSEQYEMYNRPIKQVYDNYADFVVFQSDYSRRLVTNQFGGLSDSKYEIIVNGVDTQVFLAGKEALDLHRPVRFISTGHFRNIVMLRPVIKALDSLVGKLDFEYTVVGRVEENLQEFLDRPYVKYEEYRPFTEIAELLCEQDIFLHSQLNDNCPNVVLEAVACGLPVVAFDSGGVKELLKFQPKLLVATPEKLIHVETDFSVEAYAAKIEEAVKDFTEFKQVALGNTNMHDFEICGSKYVNLFKRLINE